MSSWSDRTIAALLLNTTAMAVLVFVPGDFAIGFALTSIAILVYSGTNWLRHEASFLGGNAEP